MLGLRFMAVWAYLFSFFCWLFIFAGLCVYILVVVDLYRIMVSGHYTDWQSGQIDTKYLDQGRRQHILLTAALDTKPGPKSPQIFDIISE